MHRCSMCGQTFPDKHNLKPVRDANGYWVMLCPNCQESTPQTLNAAQAESIISEVADQLHRLQEPEEELESSARFYQRAHERVATKLEIQYSLSRDDVLHSGIVQDLSEGGLRFTTRHKLTSGQIIRLQLTDHETPESAKDEKIKSAAEVRRVTHKEDDTYDIGARFVKRIRAQEANRRRHTRYKTNLAIYYHRHGSEYIGKGRLKDLSTGGLRAVLPEPLNEDERIAFRLRGESAPYEDLHFHGEARMIRQKQLNENMVEISAEFIQMSPIHDQAQGQPPNR